ncbi:MAG: diguanylate cyclase [Planctomycetota bacterium]|nr:diguanylate cyclase [Planctomycetota bacterium]
MEAFVERLSSAAALPSFPPVARKAVTCADSDEAAILEFCDWTALDPAIACALLRFDAARKAERSVGAATTREAVMRIGPRAARVVALSALLVADEHAEPGQAPPLAGVWRRAVARAVLARRIAQATEPRRATEAYAAGALAECARVALWRVDPDAARKLASLDALPCDERRRGERGILNAPVLKLSGALLRAWKAPRRLWAALAAAGGANVEGNGLASFVSSAESALPSMLGRDLSIPDPPVEFPANASEGWGAVFSRARAEFDALWTRLHEEDCTPDLHRDTLSRARQNLTDLSLATQLENRLLKTRQEELLRRVTTDALTGVKNRLAFDERLEEEFERAHRAGKPMALLLCDLDGFKPFNDRFGHLAGDQMLRTAAQAMAHAARRIDLVARYGGEEFAIIAPHCGHDGARSLAERVRRAVEETIVEWRGQSLRVTVSIGGAVTRGDRPGRSAMEFIAAADRMLYTAKAAGRNRWFIEPEPAERPVIAEAG